MTSQDGYLIEDILPRGLKLVFCGTALGRESARQRAYYAKPGNRFWTTLHRTAFTPRLVLPQEYACVATWGIGLTDLCKTTSGNDAELSAADFDVHSFKRKILLAQPRALAFTSKKATSIYLGKPTGKIAYGWQAETIGTTALYVLPSPSGLATRYWREDVWHQLADWFIHQ